ncbi:MAG: cobalt-precorrin 5A hydrolase [Lachnospiraceae bacterium]|nr:cobalt-precorrin 5A hydrolase [Lachnospiraceae bacterium]
MIIRIISFTKKGSILSSKIREALTEDRVEIIEKDRDIEDVIKDSFEYGTALVFIGAVGIAVRKISPYVKDKLTDPCVVVIDENGEFVIPVLSGHVGGGNRLSRKIAKGIKATPVITTATDVNGKFGVDEFAVENDLFIKNRSCIKKVAKKVLEGEKIKAGIIKDKEFAFESVSDKLKEIPEVETAYTDNGDPVDILITCDRDTESSDTLILIPKRYVLGIGCKKGTDAKDIENFVMEQLNKNGIDISEVCAVASVDLKKDEEGILKFASKIKAKALFFDSDTLNRAEGDFSESEFVKKVTGVSNVCERAAVTAAGAGCETIIKKTAGNGVTMALTLRKM